VVTLEEVPEADDDKSCASNKFVELPLNKPGKLPPMVIEKKKSSAKTNNNID
jgi:hypothetical protein